MTDITKLADKWREFKFSKTAQIIGPLWEVGYHDALNGCALALESALPKWTKAVSGESSTFPEEDQEVMMYCYGNLEAGRYPDGLVVTPGDWWRPLCDLDYPPGEKP